VSYRDDHAAAIARIDALEHDHAVLAAENAQLAADKAQLAAELASAREWLGGPRKRQLAFGAAVATTISALFIGRGLVRVPAPVTIAESLPPPTAQSCGMVFGEGPRLGHFLMSATRCTSRSEGIELTSLGSDGHAVWLTSHSVEIELPSDDFFLEDKDCHVLDKAVLPHPRDPTLFDGHVELDCRLAGGDRLEGRIEFQNCR
jgi:hypothetical protein